MNRLLLEGNVPGGWRAHALLVIVLGAIAYAASFQVPFYFDDFLLLNNPVFVGHQGLAAVWQREAARALTYTTFYANYLLNGDRPWGYHLVNLLVHLATACTVLLLARTLGKTPALAEVDSKGDGRYQIAAVVAAIVFVLHPLNTQAVTYIVQRSTEFSALFYLLAIFTYIRARSASCVRQRVAWLVVCAAISILALLSKQNAATLPLALLLVEFVFFPASYKKTVLLGMLALLTITGIVVFVSVLDSGQLSIESIEYTLRVGLRESDEFTRSEYLAMQTQVLWHYTRLFIIPLNLQLEYDPFASKSWGNVLVILATGAHLAVLGSALFFVRKHPLPVFGVLFYYVAHLIESSVIPISDILVEHRTYLPNVGLCVVSGWLVGKLYSRYSQRRTVILIVTGVVSILLLVLTVQRNFLWRDPVAFFEQNTRLAPDNVRAWGQLGTAHINKMQYPAAYAALKKIDQAKLNDNTREKYYANLVIALAGMEKPEEAIHIGRQALDSNAVGSTVLRAVMLNNMAVSYAALGLNEQALRSLEESLRLDPTNVDVVRNIKLMRNAGIR